MASPESHFPGLDPDVLYEDIQGEIVADVPGRIRRISNSIVRTKDDLLRELEENPQISSLVDELQRHDFYIAAEGAANSVILTVQKHKKPIIGIAAAAIAAGALYHEFSRKKDVGAKDDDVS